MRDYCEEFRLLGFAATISKEHKHFMFRSGFQACYKHEGGAICTRRDLRRLLIEQPGGDTSLHNYVAKLSQFASR